MNEDSIKGDMRQGLGHAQHIMGDAIEDPILSLKGRATELAGRVQSVYGEAREKASVTADTVDAFVNEKPYVSAAIAAGIGVALGFFIGLGRPKVIVIRQPAARG